jgi:ABC-type phosphate transport system auxiliary subunit
MTDTEIAEGKEQVELTNALLQLLLNMTGGDPDLSQPPKRHLERALHEVRFLTGNRWLIEVTEGDVRTINYMIEVGTLNRRSSQVRTRFHTHMCKQSPTYNRLFYSRKEGS